MVLIMQKEVRDNFISDILDIVKDVNSNVNERNQLVTQIVSAYDNSIKSLKDGNGVDVTEVVKSKKKYVCSYCNKELFSEDSFCSKCGQKINWK